jgi:membrane protein YqaA with SNARE-associated domain
MVKVLQTPLVWSRRLYDWVLSWGEKKHGQTALFFLAMAEASFFPIPPDTLLIALTMGAHKKWVRFATICSIGSIVGGMLGYLIGYAAFEVIGQKILGLVASIGGGDPAKMLDVARYWFNEKTIWGLHVGPWAVGIAGFTPIPYKVFTIAAGFFEMSFPVFVLASAISRSMRFFAVGGTIGLLFEKYGVRIKDFIDKYFNALAIAFVVLLVLGFVSLKFIGGH